MKKLNSTELRQLWCRFWEERGHKVIPSSSLIPENDPTVLFTTAGMHPLVPYLSGNPHPAGKRLANIQKCVRTGDIDDVGDNRHCTFFEMLGNWSLGDYFKKDMIPWSFEFLTSAEYLGIPVNKLAITVFEGDENAPRDTESAEIWEKCGIPKNRIFFRPACDNWWGPAGLTGPCGPDTEMFIDTGKPACSIDCNPSCSCGKYVEIWNDVFMQYYKDENGSYKLMKNKNVDTGMGLERTICMLSGFQTVYETDLFKPLIDKIGSLTETKYAENPVAYRVIADHIRTAAFMLGDTKGITPSNTDQGYILRRLIRRAVRYGRMLNLPKNSLSIIAGAVVEKYKDIYPELGRNNEKILTELNIEEERFARTLYAGLKEFIRVTAAENTTKIDGATAFKLYDTFGFPIEMTCELALENGFTVDKEGFEAAFKAHQEKSAAGASEKFKGGLLDHSEITARLHTATHLLQAALRKVLGDTVCQRGSNITHERLRFDFAFPRKVEAEELKQVEDLVNAAIKADVPVSCELTTVDKAKEQGAIGLFEDKYGEEVKVYSMGGFSKEICGGPHASTTGELGVFKIQKEESSSSGVRRIKAVLLSL